ncbi:MAG TPA: hypothetical protein PK530_01600 [Anaerolineales bacterium]|nr:hypothetical protein [Anaerolineales bacterium]
MFKRLLSPTFFVALFLIVALGYTLAMSGGDPRVFATIGAGFQNGVPVDEADQGYDGQFAYFIALDPNPAHLTGKLDIPAYRYQRILYPLTARLLGLGQAALIPWTLVLVNVLAHVGATALLEQWLIAQKISRWYALIYAFWAGLIPLKSDLTEPLCYALIVAAFWVQQKGAQRLVNQVWAAMLTGLALFAKEAALFFLAAQVASAVFQRDGKRATLFAAPLLPFIAFQLYLYRTFGTIGLTSGGFMATGFEFIPYMGLWRIAEVSMVVFIVFCVLFLPMLVLPNLWGIVASVKRLWTRDFSPVVWALAANAAILPFTPFSTFREPFGMVRFMDGFVLATIFFGAHTRSKRVLNYAIFWIAALVLVIR